MKYTANHRLAVYGSLAPGRVNAHELEMIEGHWRTGIVFGTLHQFGWGADLGYPAITLDRTADPVDVFILESADLPSHWSRLDDFEGDNYRRVVTTADTDEGPLEVSIYELVDGVGV